MRDCPRASRLWRRSYVRIRPVLMKAAFAMIIGMVPMSLGLGEGGEQNAPLGRAVIGGLVVATFATLFFVPCVFSLGARKKQARSVCGRANFLAVGLSYGRFQENLEDDGNIG